MILRFFLLVSLLTSGCSLFAQTADQSNVNDDRVFLDLNTGFSVDDNTFTTTWDAKPSLHANIRVPFYAGKIEGGIRYIRFQGHAPTNTNSDFKSFFIHLGYSYLIKITSRYQIGPTLRFGNNLMRFDEKETYTSGTFRYETDPSEMEFAYEFALRNQLKISDQWYLHATLSYNRTLTRYQLPLTLISAGISYSFAEPNWLKNFLR